MQHSYPIAAVIFVLTIFGISAAAQTDSSGPRIVEPKAAESKTADQPKGEPGEVETYHFSTFPSQNELNDLQTAVRNTFTRLHMYALPTENTIVMRGSPEELAGAKKLLAGFDDQKKIYRLTYTINESDNGKRIGSQHFAVVVVSGAKTDLKQGSKVPLSSGQKGDPIYEDVGIEIEASVDGYRDGVRAHSKVVQSSIAEEKSGASVSTGDPVIRQATLEGTSLLEEGKPLVLGSIDVPGSTRHQEIEVVSELIKER